MLACKGAVGVNSKGDPTVTGRMIITTRKRVAVKNKKRRRK